MHDVGNHREYRLLGFFIVLLLQTSLVNKQSSRQLVGGNLKFSTRVSGAVEQSGVYRDKPPGCGLRQYMFFQWLQPWGLLLPLLKVFFNSLEMFQMFTQTTLRLPCRPCNCVLSCPRFGVDMIWIFYTLWTQVQLSAKFQRNATQEYLFSMTQGGWVWATLKDALTLVKGKRHLLSLNCVRKGVLKFISSSADELVPAVLAPDHHLDMGWLQRSCFLCC